MIKGYNPLKIPKSHLPLRQQYHKKNNVVSLPCNCRRHDRTSPQSDSCRQENTLKVSVIQSKSKEWKRFYVEFTALSMLWLFSPLKQEVICNKGIVEIIWILLIIFTLMRHKLHFFYRATLFIGQTFSNIVTYSTMVYYLKETCAKLVHIYNICFLI